MAAGAILVEAASQRAAGTEVKELREYAQMLRAKNLGLADKLKRALCSDLAGLLEKYPERRFATRYAKELVVVVERDKARFSSWYEMFPRSCAARTRAPWQFQGLRTLPAAHRGDGL